MRLASCPVPAHLRAMEWDAPCIVLDARPFGEGDAIVTVLTEQDGLYRGLAHGGMAQGRGARSGRATWQPGNVLQASWTARLADQLGTLRGEPVHQPAALLLDDPLGLAVLNAVCATAAGALPEREAHGTVFGSLLRLLLQPAPAAAVRWEATLLAALGYGLDFSACALTGVQDVAFVSPRTGRGVAAEAAGVWRDRLLMLPPFLRDPDDAGNPIAWRDGLRLTGHFLARDAFGARHQPLPLARVALYDRVARLAETEIA